MKRTILFISILLLIISLTSCEIADWMLGVLFDKNTGDRTIIIDIDVSSDINVMSGSSPVVVNIVPVFKNPDGTMSVDPAAILKEKFWNQSYIHWEFKGLGALSYRVVAYYDADNNDLPACTEPSAEFTNTMNNMNMFDFTMDEATKELYGYTMLNNWANVDADFITKMGGTCDGTVTDCSFWISGPGTINPTNSLYQDYSFMLNNYDMQITSFDWSVADDWGNSYFISDAYPLYDMYNYPMGVRINFANASPAIPVDRYLVLSVSASIQNKTNPAEVCGWYSTYYIYSTSSTTDPGFGFSTARIDKNNPKVEPVYIYPNSGQTVSSVQFLVYDSNWNSIGYDGNWNWISANVSSNQFSIDWKKLNPPLSDATWAEQTGLYLYLYVVYPDGTYSYNYSWIELYEGAIGDTRYTLTVNVEAYSYPYGYAYVYIVDYAQGNTLTYNSAYLDGSGYYPFTFYDIIDPAGADQQILVYLYDEYWNYIGFYTYNLTGSQSGNLCYSFDGAGFSNCGT